jgi:hypothetical protein
MVLQHLVAALQPWQSAYSNSKVIPAVVTTVHLVALLFGGGLAVAADRATLRVGRTGAADHAVQLAELRAVHRPVLVAHVALFGSGILLTAADIETFVASPMFWVKLGLVALLLANGIVLERTEATLRNLSARSIVPTPRVQGLWQRLRASAICSLVLWTATLVAGTLLVNMT